MARRTCLAEVVRAFAGVRFSVEVWRSSIPPWETSADKLDGKPRETDIKAAADRISLVCTVRIIGEAFDGGQAKNPNQINYLCWSDIPDLALIFDAKSPVFEVAFRGEQPRCEGPS